MPVIPANLSSLCFHSAERIRKLWMGRIITASSSSAPITQFAMAPCLVPRLEKAGSEIANFTCLNIAVHGPTYNRIIAEAIVGGGGQGGVAK